MIVQPGEPTFARTDNDRIQNGGFCVVVKGWDTARRKSVAIKILNSLICTADSWHCYLAAAVNEVNLTRMVRACAPPSMKKHFLRIYGVHKD